MTDRPKDLVFIASGGRTGTTFFGDLLGDVITDAYSEHEPDTLGEVSLKTLNRVRRFGLWHMVFGKMIGATGLRSVGHRHLAGDISDDDCVRRLRAMRDRWHRGIEAPLVIESSGRWWMVADVIGRAWPGAKTAGVVRDPRDWIESWRRHQPGRFTRFFPRWFPQGPLTPADVGDAAWRDRWAGLDVFGRLAWDWRVTTDRLDAAAAGSENVRIWRFEDLFGGDGRAFRDLVEFASVHGDRRYAVTDLAGLTSDVRNASRGAKRAWADWSDAEIALVEEMCGPLMRKYGYGREAEWQARVAEARAAA